MAPSRSNVAAHRRQRLLPGVEVKLRRKRNRAAHERLTSGEEIGAASRGA